MDLLQSFLGCMYPGSIRTESVESIENEYTDFSYQVMNIDEKDGEVSRGELRLNDTDLIYSISGFEPIRWPIEFIRRYGGSSDVFVFEAGRRCRTGEAVFKFKIISSADSFDRLKAKIGRFQQRKRDVSTSTESQNISNGQQQQQHQSTIPLRPLSYTLIDFDTTKALNESVQAHAASRVRQ